MSLVLKSLRSCIFNIIQSCKHYIFSYNDDDSYLILFGKFKMKLKLSKGHYLKLVYLKNFIVDGIIFHITLISVTIINFDK